MQQPRNVHVWNRKRLHSRILEDQVYYIQVAQAVEGVYKCGTAREEAEEVFFIEFRSKKDPNTKAWNQYKIRCSLKHCCSETGREKMKIYNRMR